MQRAACWQFVNCPSVRVIKSTGDFFIIKPTRYTNFTNLFWHETLHITDSLSVRHHEFIHCTLSNGICRTVLWTSFEQVLLNPSACGNGQFHALAVFIQDRVLSQSLTGDSWAAEPFWMLFLPVIDPRFPDRPTH